MQEQLTPEQNTQEQLTPEQLELDQSNLSDQSKIKTLVTVTLATFVTLILVVGFICYKKREKPAPKIFDECIDENPTAIILGFNDLTIDAMANEYKETVQDPAIG